MRTARLGRGRVMSATVIDLSFYRLVFVLGDGREVFLATHGMGRRASGIAHRRTFDCASDAADYARDLSARIKCRIFGLDEGEDVA